MKLSHQISRTIPKSEQSAVFRVLLRDRDIVVVEKKKAFISQPSDRGSKEGLGDFISRALEQPIYPVHRLDKDVLGLMVFACNEASARKLGEQFRLRTIKKKYDAWVYGKPQRDEDCLVHYLKKNSRKNLTTVYSRPTPGAKQAVLEYKVVHYDELRSCSLLEVQLHTGRPHQIRAQLSRIGHSIVGDLKYRSKAARAIDLPIQLRSSHLFFSHPRSDEKCEFSLEKIDQDFF